MPTMEIEPTDKRIDDLNVRMTEGFQLVHREIDGLDKRMTEGFKRVDRQMTEGFKRVDTEINRIDGDIRELRGDIKELRRETAEGFETQRQETNERFATVDAHLISINARFDAMHRTMMRGFFALGGVVVTLFLALAGMQGF